MARSVPPVSRTKSVTRLALSHSFSSFSKVWQSICCQAQRRLRPLLFFTDEKMRVRSLNASSLLRDARRSGLSVPSAGEVQLPSHRMAEFDLSNGPQSLNFNRLIYMGLVAPLITSQLQASDIVTAMQLTASPEANTPPMRKALAQPVQVSSKFGTRYECIRHDQNPSC